MAKMDTLQRPVAELIRRIGNCASQPPLLHTPLQASSLGSACSFLDVLTVHGSGSNRDGVGTVSLGVDGRRN